MEERLVPPTSPRSFDRLTEIGILLEVTGQARNRRFRYDPYVRLFADGPAAEDEDPSEAGDLTGA
jgi:hypothetical protein